VFERESSMVRSMDSYFHRTSSADAQEDGFLDLQAKADLGDADAQFHLGVHYSSAVGDAVDFSQAVRWYQKAADQNHAPAQYNLGMLLARGQGMPPDAAAAAGWIRKAAEGGDARGQYDLGSRSHRASLDPRRGDAKEARIEAYKWFHLAAEQGYKDSLIARQRVTLTMTRADVDEGNHRAAAFVARVSAKPQLQ
jgi:uncharacterized protein